MRLDRSPLVPRRSTARLGQSWAQRKLFAEPYVRYRQHRIFQALIRGAGGMSEEMTLNIGQVLQGRNASYRLLTALHTPTVFKAQIEEFT